MEKLIINGGRPLKGRVKISGAKNAVLPIIAATLLGQDGPSRLEEVPALEDVYTISEVLAKLGVSASFDKDANALTVDASEIGSYEAPYDLVRKMRAVARRRFLCLAAVLSVPVQLICISRALRLLVQISKLVMALSRLMRQRA